MSLLNFNFGLIYINHKILVLLKGCVRYIFASLICMSKGEHL